MPIDNNEKLLQTIEKYTNKQEQENKDGADRPKSNKTDKFLQAIQRYAKEQKNALKGEAKQQKTEKLKEAEKRAQKESDRLVKETLRSARNRQTALLAAKTQEGQRELFLERSKMVDDIFREAADRLKAYTATEDYSKRLRDNAGAIAKLFDGRSCILYVNERDLETAEGCKVLFSGEVRTAADDSIKLGGMKGYCGELGIIADETLDSRLEAQREWFIENSSLAVL